MILGWGDIKRAVGDMGAVVEDPKVLRPFAKRLQDRTRKFIESQGDGAWPPLAASTLEKRQAGTSNITKFGKVRASKLKRIASQIKKLTAQAQKNGWTDKDRKKVNALRKSFEDLRRDKAKEGVIKHGAAAEKYKAKADALTAEIRDLHRQPNKKGREAKIQRKQAQLERVNHQLKKADTSAKWSEIGTTFKGRDIGKRVGEGRMMPKMPGSIRTKIKRGTWESTVTVYSRAGIVGLAHQEGLGNDPKRTVVPDPTDEDMEFLVNLLEAEMVKRFDEGG